MILNLRRGQGMRLLRMFAMILAFQFGVSSFAIAANQGAAKRSACESVISVAKAHKFVHETSGEYHCESVDEFDECNEYFMVNLKFWSRNVPKDFVGSNLVGWYAVKKSDLKVYEVGADGNIGRWIEMPRKRRKPRSAT